MRVGVVASKKLDKRAAVRNRAKRRVREILKVELSNLPDNRFDILVTIQTSIEEVSASELQRELQQLIGRLK
jgi:ribonuclease P protein component